MKILLLGDTHGDLEWINMALFTAKEKGCDRVLQLGDFGFFPHVERGKVFLQRVCESLQQADMHMVWIDGNHENHDWLAQQNYVDGFWTLGDRLHHAARGTRWTWGERLFLACGGAYSIDQKYRTPGLSWWFGETVTEEDVERCGEDPVDVLVTHDAPWGVDGTIGPGTVGDKDDYPASEANRKRLARIVENTSPELLVHGHYHHRNTGEYRFHAPNGDPWITRVEGFSRDGEWSSMGVLDTETLKVDW